MDNDIYVDDYDDRFTTLISQRARELVETNRLDLAALLWTACILLASAGSVVRAVAHGSRLNFDGWDRIGVLSQSMDMASIGMLVIGAGVALWLRGPVTRWVLRLVFVGGAWAVVVSLLSLPTVFHEVDEGDLGGSSAPTAAVFFALALFGLGAVVLVVTGVVLARLGSDDGAGSDVAEGEEAGVAT